MHTLNLIWKISRRFPVETCGRPSSFITTYRAKAESSKKVPAFLARSAAVVLVGKRCGKSITHKLSLDNPTKLPPGKKDGSLAPDPNFLVIAHPHLSLKLTTKQWEQNPWRQSFMRLSKLWPVDFILDKSKLFAVLAVLQLI